MNKVELQQQANKILAYMEELSEYRNYETNKEAQKIYDQQKDKLSEIMGQLENLQQEERNITMKKMETRSNEFEQELRSLNTTSNATALVPENVQGEIIKRMEEVSPAFAQARKLPSVNGTLKVARENDAVTGGFFGEGESILEESINFQHVQLQQKRLGAAISLLNQLINDVAVDIVAYVNDLLGRRVAKTAEKAIFNGDGVNEFTGILGDENVQGIDVSLASRIGVDQLMDLYTSIHPDFVDGAAFYMNRSFFNQIVKLKDGNGHFYMQNGVVNGKVQYTFGSPVHVTEALQAGTTAGEVPVVFANLSEAYAILVKQEMAIKQIADGPNALRGSQLLVLDGYMDGAVTNSQAISKLNVIA
ncbi:phage major capsid protein [Radiobacillus deserti]|uniref:Phage major capsid protein n=1 Tax=Radiobacillus deserti TaxID=2594883 RepID=A0A516KDG9_9BACI|nr:phage major capsid protein [Radiobacillus deserti]QDP39439.1 phage major capsid protein [Radiobacillus deserti]